MGRCKRDRQGDPVRAGLRIRLDIVNLAFHSPYQAIKLPTINEYAQKYGISCRTVAYEFRRLAAEGWICGRRGIGTFTNPERNIFPPYKVKRIVGIISGDSQSLFVKNTPWAMLTAVGNELIPDVAYPRHLMLASYLPDDVYNEIRQQNLDALVWLFPPESYHPVLLRLRDDGLPIVTSPTHVQGLACVRSDYAARGAAIGRILAMENRGQPVWRGYPSYEYDCWRQAAAELRACGLAADETAVVRANRDFFPFLQQLLEEGRPPAAVYAIDAMVFAIVDLFAERGVDAYRDSCLICCSDTVRNHPEFRGITYQPPYAALGKKIVDLLAESFRQPHANPETHLLADTVARIG